MKLLFKQRFFSWFDSYDLYDEAETAVFTVEGQLSWGHKLHILNSVGEHMGTVREELFTLLPRFAFYLGEDCVGMLRKEFTFFHPEFTLDLNGWQVVGDFWEWDYQVTAPDGREVMRVYQEPFRWTDTYVLDIHEPKDALLCLMIVVAIDAAKCSQER